MSERYGDDDTVPVSALLEEAAAHLKLRCVAGAAGLDQRISYPRIQKAALAMTGHVEVVRPGRVQLLGQTEINYLRQQAARKRAAIMRKVCGQAPVVCFVITRGLEPPAELVEEAEKNGIPVLISEHVSSACIDLLQRLLDDRIAPRTTVHGGLIDIYGIGVLVLGESGIGKSECALDLITRGHRLVADDSVQIRRESRSILVGSGPELSQHHMEVRGLGLVNIRDLFGVSAIRKDKYVELVVLLEPWQKNKEYDRLGIDEARYAILGIELPLLRMPVAPGRNLAMLIEVATRNHLLKMRGYHAAKQFIERVAEQIDAQGRPTPRPESATDEDATKEVDE